MRSIFAMLVILSATVSAHASQSEQMKSCMEENSSTMGMKMCASDELELQESRMKSAIKKTMARLDEYKTDKSLSAAEKSEMAASNKVILTRLNKAQKAFLAFRTAECDYQSTSMLGGTGESLVVLACEASMTADRVDTLEKELASEN